MAWETKGPALKMKLCWSLRPGTGGVRLRAFSGLPQQARHHGAIFGSLNRREEKSKAISARLS